MLGTFETPIAFLTSPFVLELNKFLAASLGGTGGIRNVIGLNAHYCRSCREKFDLVRHSQLRLLHIFQTANFGAIEGTTGDSRRKCIRMGLEGPLCAESIIPTPQRVRILMFRIDGHRTGIDHRQRTP